MKKYISTCLITILLFSANTRSHSDHGHGKIKEAQAIQIASDVAAQLTTKDVGLKIGKLPEDWAMIPKENISTYKKGPDFLIMAIENTSEEKTLYILMSSTGDVYDANFSGTFEGAQ